MATFPKLKTNAIAQYPLARREQFQNQTVRFVDGSEQRYRDSAGARLEWDIQLSQLDEGELAAIEEFFLASQGAFGSFLVHRPLGWEGPRQLQPGGGRTGIGDGGGDAREHEAHRGAKHLNPMPAYPQLGSGALSQFPVQKKTAGADGGQSGRGWQHDQAGRPGS